MKKFQMDKLARSSLFVFALSMITNVLTYAYQIAMGNLMSPADYGTINTMLSLSTLISIPSGMITALAANLSARYRPNSRMPRWPPLPANSSASRRSSRCWCWRWGRWLARWRPLCCRWTIPGIFRWWC